MDFGSKTLQTPNFCPLIQNQADLEALMRVRATSEASKVGSFIIRAFDAGGILPFQGTGSQMDMAGRVITDRISLFLEKSIFAIDPATEYLYYDSKMQKFLYDPFTPRLIRNYVLEVNAERKTLDNEKQFNRTKTRLHKEFWENIASQPSLRNKLIRDVFQFATRLGADILIPPVPLALDERLLEIAKKMNEVSSEIALALGRKQCANYFLLPRSLLGNSRLLDKVKNSMFESPSRLGILKFKYIDLTNPRMVSQRETYKDLLLDLAYLSETSTNRAFMVLENYYQSFPSAVAGFDIVSTSTTGFDGEGGFSEHPAYGSWIDPKLMVHVSFDEVRRIYHNNGDRLPCYHDTCTNVKDIESITPERWNRLRREHCLLYYEDCMSQIIRAVSERNVELARERLVNSQLSSLRGLISTKA